MPNGQRSESVPSSAHPKTLQEAWLTLKQQIDNGEALPNPPSKKKHVWEFELYQAGIKYIMDLKAIYDDKQIFENLPENDWQQKRKKLQLARVIRRRRLTFDCCWQWYSANIWRAFYEGGPTDYARADAGDKVKHLGQYKQKLKENMLAMRWMRLDMKEGGEEQVAPLPYVGLDLNYPMGPALDYDPVHPSVQWWRH
ncbi:hypothetical protein EJ08DRAFT_699182 [Tothia fuscella]|uniref:Uncharacterized protein n=1 Tax=Tothia fuscella TaxID=1048955 RepID=A0A9P4NN48_9PEZI|nr:hypothetical protein EJ08DRAFT_699182 [Tothia fuscella]